MAVRDDFAPGEVLAAADLNDTFAQKTPYEYSDTEPTTGLVGGFLWFDTNDSPPTPYYYDADEAEFVPFPSGPGFADFSDAATGTYTDDGISYKYITFTASGTLTIPEGSDGFADVLVVGGGGGGGRARGGGGGAGGHLYATDVYLPSGSLTVTVGAGGARGDQPDVNFPSGLNGRSSGIGGYIVAPGGGGGGGIGQPGSNGGSGGGGGQDLANGGAGFPSQGNSGGTGQDASSPFRGGGGGGASADGASGTASGNGGNGVANSITGSSVTRAGGGGGGSVGGTAGSGGTGGGANGQTSNSNAAAGTANTGGGGGGGGWTTSPGGRGGNGGSGVVIVRVRT